MTITLRTHTGKQVKYKLPSSKATFNRTNEQISWAAWSWNPVTGCLHGCKYCYARELSLKKSYAPSYPIGFDPLFHHERLDAPTNTKVPKDADTDPRLRRVFVCSMAALKYGGPPHDRDLGRRRIRSAARCLLDMQSSARRSRSVPHCSVMPTALQAWARFCYRCIPIVAHGLMVDFIQALTFGNPPKVVRGGKR